MESDASDPLTQNRNQIVKQETMESEEAAVTMTSVEYDPLHFPVDHVYMEIKKEIDEEDFNEKTQKEGIFGQNEAQFGQNVAQFGQNVAQFDQTEGHFFHNHDNFGLNGAGFDQTETSGYEKIEIKVDPYLHDSDPEDPLQESKETRKERKKIVKKEPARAVKKTKTVQKDAAKKSGRQSKYIKVKDRFKCGSCDYKTKYRHAIKIHTEAIHSDANVKPYMCDMCDYKTKYKTALKRHIKHQHGDVAKNLKCNQCEYRTTFKTNLHKHMAIHNKLKCRICLKRIEKDEIESHTQTCKFVENDISAERNIIHTENVTGEAIKSEISEDNVQHGNEGTNPSKTPKEPELFSLMHNEDGTKSFKCNTCDHKSGSRHTAKIHQQKHSNVLHACTLENCGFSTKYPNALRRHRLSHVRKNEIIDETVQKHKCHLCGYETLFKEVLKFHVYRHQGIKKFTCKHCAFKTCNPASLTRHKKEHERVERVVVNYECAKCDFKSVYKGRYEAHLRKFHNEVIENSHVCNHCGFGNSARWRTNMHINKNKSDTPIKCLHCDFETYFNCEYKIHKKEHLGELSQADRNLGVTGEIARKRRIYNQKSSAFIHNMNDPNLHNPENFDKIQVMENPRLDGDSEGRYACYQCDFQNKFKCAVQRHYKRRHMDIFPYECNLCNFKTKVTDALSQHLKRSIVENPIKCECGFETLYKCQFVLHSQNHNKYRCNQCEYTASNKYCFKKHCQLKHGGEISDLMKNDNCDDESSDSSEPNETDTVLYQNL